MHGQSTWSNLIWGPYTITVAGAALAVISLLSDDNRPWYLIIAIVCFIAVHSAVGFATDRSIVRRLGRKYDSVQRRTLQLVADLGELVGGQFDLWMVDLYLVRRDCLVSRRSPFLVLRRQLSRELSVSLVEVSTQPAVLDVGSELHGKCIESKETIVWYDEEFLGVPDDESERSVANEWRFLPQLRNEEIGDTYGLVTLSPVMDHLGKGCVGVLVVHIKPERDKALRARGALLSAEGRRRVHNAGVDLHGLLLE